MKLNAIMLADAVELFGAWPNIVRIVHRGGARFLRAEHEDGTWHEYRLARDATGPIVWVPSPEEQT